MMILKNASISHICLMLKKELKTFNAPVVPAVMEEIKTTLDEKIREVEGQIKF